MIHSPNIINGMESSGFLGLVEIVFQELNVQLEEKYKSKFDECWTSL